MRTSAIATVATLAGLGLAVAGCGEGSVVGMATPNPSAATGSAAPTGSAGASPPSAGPVASCVTGDWRTTSAAGQTGGALASASISGGDGVLVKVGPTGATTVDFAGMRPVSFNAQLGDAKVAGRFSYAGQANGTVSTGGTGGTAGDWAPIPPLQWGDTRVTVELTEPAPAKLFDNVRIAEYVGDGATRSADVVDIQPLLGAGRYQCGGNTLTLTPKDAGGLTWVLNRA
ncbi:hypothetical protein BDK92_2449 [Micromonospora pisi]|uniref:Lipoprotein n=1 Tax=Micromonospora pisi TaxID=589240 RepID=A0A495JIJ0_9ACTN|nr:hypothetical protein [Micromonospora pisi]RKR88142.1 hypothetical protein BDK92_2449 [Micromonospora pisi]